MNITHPCFKDIKCPTENDSNDISVCWEQQRCLNGDTFNICIWASDVHALTPKILDTFAHRYCQDLYWLDHICRQYMLEALQQDDAYMRENLGEIQMQVQSPKLQHLIDTHATIAQFVQEMNLTNIALWVDGEPTIPCPFVSVDYMIDPEYSDEILCVRLDLERRLIHVAHES